MEHRIKDIYKFKFRPTVMHPEIEAALTRARKKYPAPSLIAMQNAEKLLSYIEDINLERTGKFVPTASQSLYMLWNVEDWEFRMECTKDGSILYNFRKDGKEEARGLYPVDQFIAHLERYLLLGVA
jgi:hypothetical protein